MGEICERYANISFNLLGGISWSKIKFEEFTYSIVLTFAYFFSHNRKKYNKNTFFSASEQNETSSTTVTVLSPRRHIPMCFFSFLAYKKF